MTIRVWDLNTGKELHVIDITWNARYMVLSPTNPSMLITANGNCTLTAFDLPE
jgi:WD40 repeat protein